MESPEELGRLALRMKPDGQKRLKDTSFTIQKEEGMARTRKLANKQEQRSTRLTQLQDELMQRGNPPRGFTYDSQVRGTFMGIILLIAGTGEFIIGRWTIMPFGLGQWETNIVAITIVILSLEGVNSYITYLRKRKPKLEDQIFLLFSGIGFTLLMLLMFFGADVRQVLFQTNAALSASNSLENTVDSANAFQGGAHASFVWLMVTLSAAITIVGGVAYHDVKNRILMALAFRKLYSDIGKTEGDLQEIIDQKADIESQTNSFEALFEHGFLKAQVEQQEAEQRNAAQESNTQNIPRQLNSPPTNERSSMNDKLDSLIVLSPVLLIVLALLIFFLFRGTARAETIIFLDMSKSMESSDYKGQQTEFQKNVGGIEAFFRQDMMPGDKVKVLGITESSFSNPYLLLEGQISANKGSFGEIVARDKLRLVQTWKKLSLKPVAKMTDVFGALNLGSNLFSPQDRNKKLILFSDMRHYTREIDLESPKVIDMEAGMKQVVENGFTAPLAGVKVWCVGVHSAGKTPDYWRSLKAFWREYFRQSKAFEPIVFSMERRVLNYE